MNKVSKAFSVRLGKYINRFGFGNNKIKGLSLIHRLRALTICDELRAYVEVYHLFPDKHTRLSHKVKYTRKKINEGTLEEWKRVMFEVFAKARDLSIHTGGSKPKVQTE